MKKSKWKGFFIEQIHSNSNTKIPKIMSRKNSISPKLVEQTFQIHNGLNFKSVTIVKEMLGHKFGEFVRTRATFEYKKKKKKK